MGSQPTRGPWVLTDTRESGNYPGIIQEVRNSKGDITQCLQVYPFYDCDPNSGNYARHSADKRLIESAPKLLDCLQNLRDEARLYLPDLRRSEVDATTLLGAIKQAEAILQQIKYPSRDDRK